MSRRTIENLLNWGFPLLSNGLVTSVFIPHFLIKQAESLNLPVEQYVTQKMLPFYITTVIGATLVGTATYLRKRDEKRMKAYIEEGLKNGP